MASMYDPSAYGGGAPTSGGAAAVGYALQGAKAVKDYLSKRKAKKTDERSPASSQNPGSEQGIVRDIAGADHYEAKRGGKVIKTGRVLVHKGERVLTKAQQKRRKRGRGSRR